MRRRDSFLAPRLFRINESGEAYVRPIRPSEYGDKAHGGGGSKERKVGTEIDPRSIKPALTEGDRNR